MQLTQGRPRQRIWPAFDRNNRTNRSIARGHAVSSAVSPRHGFRRNCLHLTSAYARDFHALVLRKLPW